MYIDLELELEFGLDSSLYINQQLALQKLLTSTLWP